MIDRKKGPKITTEFDLSVNSVAESLLSNGVELIEINDGTQDIIKIELIFKTGRIHESKIASAKAAISLIREGSTRHTAAELAHTYDFYGAVVKASCAMEYASISLVIVEKYFAEVWPIWLHMVFYPTYAPSEIEKHKAVQSQKLIEQLSQNDIQSYRRLTEIIFGTNHPYGYNTEPTDIQSLSRRDILDFFNKNIGTDDSILILSGKYSSETRIRITKDLEAINRTTQHPIPNFYDLHEPAVTDWIKTDNEVQTSIKLGRTLFPADHDDYPKMQLLNMVLGGYFGSRLMKNIREEKGYTYGIYSAVHGWKSGGFIYISADVDNSYKTLTLTEIKSEMQQLQKELIPEEELDMVKNYVLGQTLHLLDGPFAKGQLMKNLKVKDKDLSIFQENIEALKLITAADLLEVAKKYLDYDAFTIVMAGNPPSETT